ncbi:hypothetical protein M2421_003436 [Stenotrophomonas sp. BIGb0135]|nr:hypothetical protein [Stenotrophomonas sp. BIGb0135]
MRSMLIHLLTFALLGPLAGCSSASSHGADRYFEGKALDLAIASETGDAGEIRRLMKDEGVDPDVAFSKREGIPLLAWPLRTQSLEGLRAMLESGADPNARRVRQLQGKPYRDDNAMVYAAQLKDPRYLRLLLEHGGDPNTRNADNETLLFQAFISGNQWQNVQLLVDKGANVNESNRGSADTVLSWYTGRGGFKQAYWLLEHGADPTLMYVPPEVSGKPTRMTIAEDIYWEITSPDHLPWQKKCQQWLIAHGVSRPPMPSGIRAKREAFNFPSKEEDVPLL